jgi:hypothetical protein
MKRLSGLMMLIGIFVVVYSMMGDVSVASYGGERVTNLGLMHDRMINLVLGGFIFICGLLLRMFGEKLIEPESLWDSIENSPRRRFIEVVLLAVISAWIAWSILIVHTLNSSLFLMVIGVGVAVKLFRARDFNLVAKKLAVALAVVSLGMMLFHILSMFGGWANYFTMLFIMSIAPYLSSPSILVGLIFFYVLPIAVSTVLYLYFRKRVPSI